jgi:hypothetical protein
LSDPITIGGKLPEGSGNGLMVIHSDLIRHPEKYHVVIGIVDCSKITKKPDTGEIIPTARFRRCEVVTADDLGIAERLMSRSLDARLGHEQLPFDLEQDIHAAFKDAHRRGDGDGR